MEVVEIVEVVEKVVKVVKEASLSRGSGDGDSWRSSMND